MADETAEVEVRELAAEIVSAYVSRNELEAEMLPGLIHRSMRPWHRSGARNPRLQSQCPPFR